MSPLRNKLDFNNESLRVAQAAVPKKYPYVVTSTDGDEVFIKKLLRSLIACINARSLPSDADVSACISKTVVSTIHNASDHLAFYELANAYLKASGLRKQ